jgi:hypothetical protein
MIIEEQKFSEGTVFKIRNRKTQRFLANRMNAVDSVAINDESEQLWMI